MAQSSSSEQEAEQRARPPLPLLDLPHELLEKAVALLRPHEWGSFARASKTAKAIAQGAVGAMVEAEVSRRLVANVRVGNRLCVRCPALEISVPITVTTICEAAFAGCSGLTSVTIPPSVTRIEEGAFADCSGLTSVTILPSVTIIGWGAFAGCSGLTSVTIPPSVTRIEEGAFEGCSGLTSVTIPPSVTSIGWQAFEGCSGLMSVAVPRASVVESEAFESTTEVSRYD